MDEVSALDEVSTLEQELLLVAALPSDVPFEVVAVMLTLPIDWAIIPENIVSANAA